MEFKRKVIQEFWQRMEGIKKRERNASIGVWDEKRDSVSSTCSTKSKKIIALRLRDDERFIPKNLILCLTLKKIILGRAKKMRNFTFMLLRSLYKEWKIHVTHKRKVNSRSASFSYKRMCKKNYLKNRQEKFLLEVMKKNKNRETVNRMFFVWNKELHRRLKKKDEARMKMKEVLKKVSRKAQDLVLREIRKFWIIREKYLELLIFVQKVLKKKLMKEVFLRKKGKFKIQIKQFVPISKPGNLRPVVMYWNKRNNVGNTKLVMIQEVKMIPAQKMEKFRKGFWILSVFQGFRRLTTRKALNRLKEFSSNLKVYDKLKASVKLFSILLNCITTRKKQVLEKSRLYSNYKNSLKFLKKPLEQSTTILQNIITSHHQKSKIIAFTKIYLKSSRTLSLKSVKNGLSHLTNALHKRILNSLYNSFFSIQDYSPIREIYITCIKKSPLLMKSLNNIFKTHKQSLKNHFFSKLRIFVIYPKIKDFCCYMRNFLFKQKFKRKIEFFSALKQVQSFRQRRLYLNCMKMNYMLRNVYLKKIAYAFINWGTKMNSLRISNCSAISQWKKSERRMSSYDFSTCDSRRARSVKEILKILPRPTSIHDYIDDFFEVTKDPLDTNYF